MRILVTGGSGFLGTILLADLRAANHRVTNFDRHPSPTDTTITCIGDIRTPDQLVSAACDHDVIIHLAAEHRDDIHPASEYDKTNVIGTHNVISAARKNGIKTIIFTSTVALYGLTGGTPNEDSPIAPFNDYGRSKYEAEQILRAWALDDPTHSLCIVRPSVIFGEGNRGNVYTMLHQINAGRFVMVGAGTNRKSMAYVKNVSEFIVHLLQAGPGSHIFNYADQPDMTSGELVALAASTLGRKSPLKIPFTLGLIGGAFFDGLAFITGRRLPISSVRVRKFCAETTIATDRISQLGFKPSIPLRDALRRTIAHEFKSSGSK